MECIEAILADFAVDDLLDFSNADNFVREESSSSQREEDKQEREKAKSFSDQSTHLSPLEDLFSFPVDVPVGDLEDLEWLSNFVDDSFSESYLSSDLPVNPVASVEVQRQCIPVKPRSKRRRTNCHMWSLDRPSPSLSTAVAEKKRKGRQKAEASCGGGVQQQQRRCCSHCGVQKTPQWRMGPLGAKTLCNACGVRFKSGRLLPEYRPALSPTFSTEIHSNSHRKVLELRLMITADPGRV
ncbi:GATA transcription factor 7 [Cardamine amara subsp. amara]|uniref:GATA transcription factor n=1 Tax=Cardamine amara subsp. amara TaxID=228776 RepID=A0ABD1BHE5_CARAN